MNQIRTIVFVVSAPIIGGAERYLINIVTNLDKSKWNPVVAGPKSSCIIKEMAKWGIKVKTVEIGPKLSHHNIADALFKWPLYLFRLGFFLRKMKRNCPSILVHFQYKKEQIIGTFAAAMLGLPVVWTEHAPISVYRGLRGLVKWPYRIVGSLVAKVIVFSQVTLESLSALGFKRDQITIVPLGIELRPYYDHEFNNLVKSSPLLGCVSRFESFKGLNYLIEAMPTILKRFPYLRLVLVGDGCDMSNLKQLVAKMGLQEQVIFTGAIQASRIPDVLSKIDLFIHPSIKEGTPLSIIEALAACKPVIATDVGGTSELVRNSLTGLLIPPASPSAIVDAVTYMLTNWRAARAMAVNGQKKIFARYNLGKMVSAVEEVFERIPSSYLKK